ncbi:MAG TPA: paraquat-inducible protein A [Steroidobacteraceae bacterium]|nr:paraquat-inducible protein A [Steroidobacteraceae bacterium]
MLLRAVGVTIACPECGTLEEIPRLLRRDTAVCVRCRTDLEKTTGRSLGAALACSLATLLLLVPVNVLPLLRVDIFGMHSQNITAAGVSELWGRGWILLAGLSALFIVILPFLRFGLLSAVLAALRFERRPAWLGSAFRWSNWLDPWAMLDVYLVAGCVGYYRLINIDQARITIQLGGACFIAAAFLTMLSRATLDQRTVWRAIGGETRAARDEPALGCTTCDLVQPLSREGERCPRCGARLRLRKLDAAAWTAALLVAALVLIFPANIYPMNISNHLGQQVRYTIMTGVQDLFKSGLYPLGVLIFCTSILTPAVKIFALGWCVLSVWRRSRRHLVVKTKVLRIIAEMGRWSKTDPFAIVFFVPLIHFGALGNEQAGWGATAFMMMTFLTMVASVTFDPRLMWDAAGSEMR